MAEDHITEIRIEGLRCLKRVRLALSAVNVLIGENGSGKSSAVEALQILSRATSDSFYREIHDVHGGLGSLLRIGANRLSLGIRIEGGTGPLEYDFSLRRDGMYAAIESEALTYGPVNGVEQPLRVLDRKDQVADVFDERERRLVRIQAPSQSLVLNYYGTHSKDALNQAIPRVQKQLEGIEVHLPFDVRPNWAERASGRESPLRSSSLVRPAERLELLGANLSNAYFALKNDFGESHWRETLEYVRLGLGEDVEVNTVADPGGGKTALTLKYRRMAAQVHASALSDGSLAYLGFVALMRLGTRRSLLAFDEPDLHLHPSLIGRVIGMFEAISTASPVVLTTHSDRLLDFLSDPVDAVILCELDQARATQLLRPDGPTLAKWLRDYRGIGDIRGAGHEASIMTRRD